MPIGTSDGQFFETEWDAAMGELSKVNIVKLDTPMPKPRPSGIGSETLGDLPKPDLDSTYNAQMGHHDFLNALGEKITPGGIGWEAWRRSSSIETQDPGGDLPVQAKIKQTPDSQLAKDLGIKDIKIPQAEYGFNPAYVKKVIESMKQVK